MCAIIGYATKGEIDLELVHRLFNESRVRGLHAFGIAYQNAGGGLEVQKSHDLKDIFDTLFRSRPKSFIGHCRYSTSGDFKDHRNNQPVVRHGGALVFNGVIHMGTKVEMERDYGVTLLSENDGEIVLAMEGTPITELVDSMEGSFAGLLLNDLGITAIRNERRPAWVARFDDSLVVASTRDILRRSAVPWNTHEELLPGVPYKIT